MCFVVPVQFFGCASTISHFGERFRDGHCSFVSFLFEVYSRCPLPCPAICKTGAFAPVAYGVAALVTCSSVAERICSFLGHPVDRRPPRVRTRLSANSIIIRCNSFPSYFIEHALKHTGTPTPFPIIPHFPAAPTNSTVDPLCQTPSYTHTHTHKFIQRDRTSAC